MLAAVGHSSQGNEGIMYSSPDRIGQLARDHHHEMIAAARQRQPRAARSRPAPPLPPPPAPAARRAKPPGPPPPRPHPPPSHRPHQGHPDPHPDPGPLGPRDLVGGAPYLLLPGTTAHRPGTSAGTSDW